MLINKVLNIKKTTGKSSILKKTYYALIKLYLKQTKNIRNNNYYSGHIYTSSTTWPISEIEKPCIQHGQFRMRINLVNITYGQWSNKLTV